MRKYGVLQKTNVLRHFWLFPEGISSELYYLHYDYIILLFIFNPLNNF